MAKKNLVGAWAFLIGVILAVLVALLGMDLAGTTGIILVILGLIVGLLNIGSDETKEFLMAGVVLVIVGSLSKGVLNVIPQIGSMMDALVMLFVPATIIVALKSVFSIAKR